MSEKKDPLANADDYMKHCTKCPNFSRGEDGRPMCCKIEEGGHGQLRSLVKEGMPCPEGKFGDAKPLSEKPAKPAPAKKDASDNHFIFTILSSCQSATFHFEDGDLKWIKK